MTSPNIVDVHDLSFAYPGEPVLVRAWSASIGAGITQIHGDTGSGKSTLLRLLAGKLAAKGRLTVAGFMLADKPEAYRRNVWYEATCEGLEQTSARDHAAALGASETSFDLPEWQALVEGFALAPNLDKPLYMLSTGSKRKVGLAAALASGRALVLLDEPAGALDAASLKCLWPALERCAAQRAIVVASAERIGAVPLAGSIDLPLAPALERNTR